MHIQIVLGQWHWQGRSRLHVPHGREYTHPENTGAITRKVKQEFAAKERAKYATQSTTRTGNKAA